MIIKQTFRYIREQDAIIDVILCNGLENEAYNNNQGLTITVALANFRKVQKATPNCFYLHDKKT